MYICPFCAEEIKDEAKFCRYCGKRVKGLLWRRVVKIAIVLCIVLAIFAKRKQIKEIQQKVQTNAQYLVNQISSLTQSLQEMTSDLNGGTTNISDYQNLETQARDKAKKIYDYNNKNSLY